MPDFRWGYKVAWLAIRSEDQTGIAQTLQATKVRSVSWEQGVKAAYERDSLYAFISSAVKGWTFVVSRSLMGASPETLENALNKLSSVFGEAHYYMSYRVSSCISWACSRKGEIIRGLSVGDGEICWNEGSLTPIEDVLLASEAAQLKERGDSYEGELFIFLGEQEVLEVAESWSINPMKLDETLVTKPEGLLAKSLEYPDLCG